jgi:hypothetical protein
VSETLATSFRSPRLVMERSRSLRTPSSLDDTSSTCMSTHLPYLPQVRGQYFLGLLLTVMAIGQRSSSRSNSCETGFELSPPPRVFTNSDSSMLSTTRRTKMRTKGEKGKRDAGSIWKIRIAHSSYAECFDTRKTLCALFATLQL